MAPQPQGGGLIGAVSDDALDAAIADQFDGDEPETPEPTEAPESPTSGPSVEDDTPESADSDTAPAGDATPDPAPAAHPAPESAPAAASQPAATDEGKPFQFKASGTEQVLPWAVERADGSVVIPKDNANEFRRVLASQRELETNFRQAKRHFDRELAKERTTRTQKDAEADAVIGLMSDLLALTPEQQFQYLTELQGNFPKLQLDLQARQLAERQKMLEQQARGPQLSPEEQQEQVVELATNDLAAEWQRLQTLPELQVLTAQERQQVYDRWAKKPQRLVRPIATEAEAQQYGGKIGDHLFDPSELHDDLLFLVNAKKAAQPAQPTKAAARNAQLNADRRQVPVNRIPPTVRSTAPTGQPRGEDGKFQKLKPGTKAYRDYMMSSEDEDDAA